MSGKANPKTVGVFIVGAVVLAAASVVMFGSGKLFAETYPFMIFFDGAVDGLSVGAPVKYRGVDVGTVKEVNISISSQNFADVRMPVVIELNARKIHKHTSTEVRLGNQAFVDSMIDGGLRATLATGSLVTGTRHVAIDIYPDAPPPPEHPETDYFVIPTHTTGFEQLENDIKAFIDKLGDIDPARVMASIDNLVAGLDTVVSTVLPELLAGLPATIDNLNETMNAVQAIADNLDSQIGPMREELTRSVTEMTATMDEVEATLVSIRAVTEPESPMIVQLEETLANMSQASLGIARLVDFIERDPSSLIRGKSKEGN